MKWLIGAVALAAVVWLASQLFGTKPAPVVTEAPAVAPAATGPLVVDGVNIGDSIQGILTNLTGTLGGEFGVRVAGLAEDQGEGRLVYEPGHPDANDAGYVRYPDIDTTQEMVKLMDAKRIFEANAAVFQTAKSMLRASLDI